MTSVHPAVVRLDGTARLSPEVIGGKAFGIDMMRRHGLPVPPAFCLTTAVGADFLTRPGDTLDGVWDGVLAGVGWLERQSARTFGRGPQPLLLGVRGGAARSMPGLLATVLDVGITPEVREALAEAYGPAVATDIATRFASGYTPLCGKVIPEDPADQLRAAITAVFSSWNSPSPLSYRHHYGLDDNLGTAAVVQAMVFGNLARDSGTGVVFSRNPVTGTDEPFGEWTPGRQGTDLVSGIADGQPLAALARSQPAVHRQLLDAAARLADLAGEPVEVEFTVESGRLWILQSRVVVGTVASAVPQMVESTMATTVLATGTPASPGSATGRAYADVDAALDAADRGESVILLRPTTSPDDVPAMFAARGVVTEIGGATSHAAVLSREIGRPAVVGCGPGLVDRLDGRLITVDGTTGEVREPESGKVGDD
ncbi:MAG TPA: PEP/pyruvate-binding domain-containing protein [Mycobacterium sp.]|nr:PEP/pyruvate-binding domain-containing protein [Mycobacterium sp.]